MNGVEQIVTDMDTSRWKNCGTVVDGSKIDEEGHVPVAKIAKEGWFGKFYQFRLMTWQPLTFLFLKQE
jgi:hypothetical protein